jgi:hypothetical protein
MKLILQGKPNDLNNLSSFTFTFQFQIHSVNPKIWIWSKVRRPADDSVAHKFKSDFDQMTLHHLPLLVDSTTGLFQASSEFSIKQSDSSRNDMQILWYVSFVYDQSH